MLYLILRWFLYALLILFIAWLIPGISITGIKSALLVAVILGILNVLIKPILNLITLPLNIVTLGLFGFVINAFILILAGKIAPGFSVDGFLSALIGAFILSVLGVGISNIGDEH